MKLKLLREHYQNTSTSSNRVWTPKISFKSVLEIRKAGFFPGKWVVYRCTLCSNLHVAKKRK